MIIVKIDGGLGNQMFQYACAKSLSLSKKQKLKLDIESFNWDQLRQFELSIFTEKHQYASQYEIELTKSFKPSLIYRLKSALLGYKTPYFKQRHFLEKSFNFDVNLAKSLKDIYLEGYWQSEKYFKINEKIIREIFRFKKPPNEYYGGLITSAEACNSVSVHIRRGDYVKNPETNNYHGICDINYYIKAMSYIIKLQSNTVFFMISDDIEWVKNEFKCFNFQNIVYVENNKGEDFEDMRLMSICKHNVIANSSFSWWGAWLNETPNKIVLAPSIWFKNKEMQEQIEDLIPIEWTVI